MAILSDRSWIMDNSDVKRLGKSSAWACGPPIDMKIKLSPCKSLVRNVRFEPICVAPSVPAGRVVARDGVYIFARAFRRFHVGQPTHRELLSLQLERLQLIDEQIAKLNGMIAQALKPHQETVMRLAEVPGFGVDSAQQVIAEVGVKASTFPSAAEFASWVGTCPGKDESAEENHSGRSAKGNKYLRRLLSQVAHAAVKKNGSHFQAVFRRLLPRLGYQSAIGEIAHRLCRVLWKILHEGVRFIEQGKEPDPQAKKQRARILARALRKLGYNVAISPMNPPTAESATPTQ
jgi:hypothetical protein